MKEQDCSFQVKGKKVVGTLCSPNFEKKVPMSMISPNGFGVTDEFITYAAPLIEGEVQPIYKNGVISFISR